RPDGLYGAAKAYMEALGRFASDASGLPVSVLRIGTIRSNLSLQELIDSDELPYLGFGEARAQRLKRTWLTGDDLVNILEEEFTAYRPYRLRPAPSSPDRQQCDHSGHPGVNLWPQNAASGRQAAAIQIVHRVDSRIEHLLISAHVDFTR